MTSVKKRFQRDFLLQLPGYLLVCSLITATLSGLLLACYYIPTPAKAALSIDYIKEQVFAGTTIITIHRLSGISIFIFTLLNLIMILRIKKISVSWITIWRTGIVLIILFVFYRITGYLLNGSNSAAYLLKTLLIKFSNSNPNPASSPQLFSTLPVAFVRVYLLHILILPILTGIAVYKHINGLKHLEKILQPVTIPPIVILAAYIAFIIGISLFIKPAESPISDYTENLLANVPWIIKSIIGVIKTLSFPGAIILSLVLLFLILSTGNIIKNLKTKIATKTQSKKKN